MKPSFVPASNARAPGPTATNISAGISWRPSRLLEGAPNELSLYATESYWTGNSSALRRYTLRLDGFVSAQAPMSGGELITKPLRFHGRKLTLNFATAAAGSIRVEIQDVNETALPGFALEDCPPLFGDTLERDRDVEKRQRCEFPCEQARSPAP